MLWTLVAGKEVEQQKPYVNYPYGSRFLEAIVLGIVDLRAAKILYSLLSYGSVLLLIWGAWRSSPETALMVSPIFVFLLFGFAQHLFGQLARVPDAEEQRHPRDQLQPARRKGQRPRRNCNCLAHLTTPPIG